MEERGDHSLDVAFFDIFARLPTRHVVMLVTALKLLASVLITYATAMSGSEILHEVVESLSHVWNVLYSVKVNFAQVFACDNDKRVLKWIMRPTPEIQRKKSHMPGGDKSGECEKWTRARGRWSLLRNQNYRIFSMRQY